MGCLRGGGGGGGAGGLRGRGGIGWGGSKACSLSPSLFLHTSAAGGQGCAEATASQLPNSLSNLLVGFEPQRSLRIVTKFSAAVVDV